MVTIEEGKYYRFRIEGEVKGVDGEELLKLSDPNGVKHLLNTQWYKNYNLKAGETVICHIDKINCSGRIFIEPVHPVYKPDEIFDFEVVDSVKIENNNYFLIKDVFDNKIEIPEVDLPSGTKPGDIVPCRVLTVKKGKPVLIPVAAEPDYSGFIEGDEYQFKVSGMKRYSGKYSFFILSDEKGNEYLLRKKFYEEYGIKTGDTIKCTFKKTGKESYFEPEHPYYKKGRKYDFFIIGEDFIYSYPDGKEEAIVLLNNYGKEILISRKDVNPEILNSNKISCVVKDIVKGQLVLDCS